MRVRARRRMPLTPRLEPCGCKRSASIGLPQRCHRVLPFHVPRSFGLARRGRGTETLGDRRLAGLAGAGWRSYDASVGAADSVLCRTRRSAPRLRIAREGPADCQGAELAHAPRVRLEEPAVAAVAGG